MFNKQQGRAKTAFKAIFNNSSGSARQRLDESRQALIAQFPVNTKTQSQCVSDNKG